MYATAKATEEATCAVCMTVAQFVPPILGAFSGTTTMSPGRRAALIGSPDHQPPLLFFEEMTEPSARITNTAFLSAMGVSPPAWLKYHFADRPCAALIAVGLNTCPLTITVFAFFGITRTSPSRKAISAEVFFQRLTSDAM